MTLALLFGYFFYIGVVALGGGLAIIPFLEQLVQQTGWITLTDLSNIVALAEMTPGAIGVNMATYTGFMTAGFLGSLTATLGLITPEILMVCLISRLWKRWQKNPAFISAFQGVKASVIGLLFSVFISLFFLIFHSSDTVNAIGLKLALFGGLLWVIIRYRPNPIYYIIGMGVIGIMLNL